MCQVKKQENSLKNEVIAFGESDFSWGQGMKERGLFLQPCILMQSFKLNTYPYFHKNKIEFKKRTKNKVYMHKDIYKYMS